MNHQSIINRIAAGAIAAVIGIGAYLGAPPPQRAVASFDGPAGWAGTASGTANALVLNVANVQSLGDLVGVTLHFNPAFNNTGPVTIAVQSASGTTSPTAVLRPSSIGLVAFSLNEFWASETTSVFYNGTAFVLSSNVDMRPIGSTCEFRGSGAPRGCLIEDGTCASSTQFAALATVLGTTYGVCAGVKLPVSNGTAFMAADGQGANGSFGRITTASCASPNTIGQLCGTETKNLTIANLDTFRPTVNSYTITGTGTVPVTGNTLINGNSDTTHLAVSNNANAPIGTVSIIMTSATGGGITMDTLGSGTAHPVLNPVMIGIRAIKY